MHRTPARTRRLSWVLLLCGACGGPAPRAKTEEGTGDSGVTTDPVDSGDSGSDTGDSGDACTPAGTDWCEDGLDQDCDGEDEGCAGITIPGEVDRLVSDDDIELAVATFPGGLIIGSWRDGRVYTWRGPVDGAVPLSGAARTVEWPPEARTLFLGLSVAAYGDDGSFVASAYTAAYRFDATAADPVLTVPLGGYAEPGHVAVGDYTADGTLDFTVTESKCWDGYDNARRVRLVDGSGRGSIGTDEVAAEIMPNAAHAGTFGDSWIGCRYVVNAGDTDGDGVDELLLNGDDAHLLFRGPLAGSLAESDADATMAGTPTPAGDVDGDGLVDLALRDATGADVVRASANGELGADVVGRAACPNLNGIPLPGHVAIQDFNHDDALDLALGVDTIDQPYVWIAHGPLSGTVDCSESGQFLMIEGTREPLYQATVTPADLDMDGTWELVVNLSVEYVRENPEEAGRLFFPSLVGAPDGG